MPDSSLFHQAIALAVATCFVSSLLLNISLMLAIPSLPLAMADGGVHAVPDIFRAHFSGFVWNFFNGLNLILTLTQIGRCCVEPNEFAAMT